MLQQSAAWRSGSRWLISTGEHVGCACRPISTQQLNLLLLSPARSGQSDPADNPSSAQQHPLHRCGFWALQQPLGSSLQL